MWQPDDRDPEEERSAIESYEDHRGCRAMASMLFIFHKLGMSYAWHKGKSVPPITIVPAKIQIYTNKFYKLTVKDQHEQLKQISRRR